MSAEVMGLLGPAPAEEEGEPVADGDDAPELESAAQAQVRLFLRWLVSAYLDVPEEDLL